MAQGNYPIQGTPFNPSQTLSEIISDRFNKSKAIEQEQKNPYVGQRELEALLKDRLVNKYYGRDKESEIGLRGAQAGNLNEEATTSRYKRNNGLLEPETIQLVKAYKEALEKKHAMEQQNQPIKSNNLSTPITQALNQQTMSNQYGMTPIKQSISDSLVQSMSPPRQQQPVQQPQQSNTSKPGTIGGSNIESSGDPILDAQLMKGLGLSTMMNPERFAGAGGKALAEVSKQIQIAYPNLTPEDAIDARDRMMDGYKTYSDGRPLPEMTAAIRSAISKNYKGDTDVAQRSQQRFARTLDDIFNIADTHINDASKFITELGKQKGNLEAVKGQFGENSKEYLAYKSFIDEDVPAMVTEIIRAGGAHSTNAQKAVAYQQAMQTKGLNNSQVLLSNYAELKKLYKTIGKAAAAPSYENANRFNGSDQSAQNPHAALTDEELNAKIARLQGG